MKEAKKQLILQRLRTKRARSRLTVTPARPRLSVFRSAKHISAQIIDYQGQVLVSASDTELTGTPAAGKEKAAATGKLLAGKAQQKKISTVLFDKSHYKYHGRVKALADGAREGGLEF